MIGEWLTGCRKDDPATWSNDYERASVYSNEGEIDRTSRGMRGATPGVVIIPACIVPTCIINGCALWMNRRTNPPDYPPERMVLLSHVNHTHRRRFAPPAIFCNHGDNFSIGERANAGNKRSRTFSKVSTLRDTVSYILRFFLNNLQKASSS